MCLKPVDYFPVFFVGDKSNDSCYDDGNT